MNSNIITKRVEKLRALMSEKGIDVFTLIVDERLNSESCHYISGFRGSSAGLIITMNESTLITDGRYTTQAKSQTPFNIIIQSELTMPEYLARTISDGGYLRAGFEAGKISHATYTKYFAPVKCEWIDASEMIPILRRTKDSHEVELIREAGKIARNAFGNVLELTHAGMSETEFEILLTGEIKRLGAEKGWAHDDFIVASGERSAMCHAPATAKVFADGESVTVDYGAMYEGYMSDITRNFAIGHADPKAFEINAVLLKAHHEAVKALRPGVKGADVDGAARKVIADSGYGEYFVHGLGHGLGLEVHESPRLSRTSKDILQAGDVVTVEPGIYIEGWGGLRIEDDYLITEDGCECLTVNDNQSLIVI